jgi:hypothetical protein
MSPHAVILLAAAVLGAAGKLLLPQFTLRTVAISALALPLLLCLYLGEAPSLLGLLLLTPISLTGAVAGVAAGSALLRYGQRRSG